MKKKEIINIIMSVGNLPYKKAREIVNSLFDAIKEEFNNDEKVKTAISINSVVDFGDLSVSLEKGRKWPTPLRIAMVDGDVVYIKKDGTVSIKPVAFWRKIEFLGFPSTGGCNAKLISGDPFKDEIIFVVDSDNTWIGSFVISKKTKEKLYIEYEDIDLVKRAFHHPIKDIEDIKKILRTRPTT